MHSTLIAIAALTLNISALPLQAQHDTLPTPAVPASDSITYHIRVIPGDTTVDRKMPMVAPDDFVAVDTPPVPVKLVAPVYPRLRGKKDPLEGTVWVRCYVREDGTVGDVVVVRSNSAIFNEAAVACVKQWLFTPAMRHGKPVGVWAAVPVRVRPE